MAWRVYFWYNSNSVQLSVFDDIFDLVLSVVLILFKNAFLSDFWVVFEFQSKSLVVRQVPMQHIHFIDSHCIDLTLYGFDFQKVSRRVKHYSSVHKIWRVSDQNWDFQNFFFFFRNQLCQGFQASNEAEIVFGFDLDHLSCDLESIGFICL